MTEYDISDITKILEELSIQELISYLQSFLVENNTKWIGQNFSLIYQTSFKHDSFSDLQKFCTDLHLLFSCKYKLHKKKLFF